MLLDELKNYKVYLASKSPRRRELLTDMGIDFEILAAEVEESFDPTLPPACHKRAPSLVRSTAAARCRLRAHRG